MPSTVTTHPILHLFTQTDRQTDDTVQPAHTHTWTYVYKNMKVSSQRGHREASRAAHQTGAVAPTLNKEYRIYKNMQLSSTRICNLVSATVDHHTTQVSAAPPQSECYTCTSLGPPKDALTRISRQRSTGTEDRRSCERAPKITWTSTEDHVNEHRRSRERTGTKRSCGENSGEKIKHACAYVHAQCSCTYTHAPMV